MLTSLYYAQALKWVLPASILLGTSPTYMSNWFVWRLLTLLFPSRVFERGDEMSYAFYQRLVLFFYENWTGVQIVLYGDYEKVLQKKENVVFMSNHQSTVDWVIADMLAERQGSLGNIRYILKDGLKYFPIYGYYFRQHSCIYVKRGGMFSQGKAAQQLQQFNKNKTPFWMVVFPEGTRYNPDLPHVIEKSQQFAIEQGETALKQHLTPRIKALRLCIEQLRDCADAVYDVTAAYSGTSDPQTGCRLMSPGLNEFLSGACKELHIHVSRIPISDVPSDETAFKHWLYETFHKKDRLMQRFYSDDPAVQGTLGDDGKPHSLGLYSTLPTFLFWAALNTPVFCTPIGRDLYWKTGLFTIAVGWGWMALS